MDDSGALTGITVITLAVNLPGPLTAARLTAMGARVLKVEPPSGDPLQHVAPQYYRELAAHQEVMTLDLKTDSDKATLDSLAADAHVLLTSMRPRAAAALGLPALVERHGLVHVEIVGFNGDRADVPGHDLTYQAAHGSLVPGTMPTVPVADVLGGERAVTAALAGLRLREQAPASTSGGRDGTTWPHLPRRAPGRRVTLLPDLCNCRRAHRDRRCRTAFRIDSRSDDRLRP